MGIALYRLVISSPFRELCPTVLQGPERTEERQHVRRQQNKEALDVVPRGTVGTFVQKRRLSLFESQSVKHAVGNDQPRMHHTSYGQHWSLIGKQQRRRGLSRHVDLATVTFALVKILDRPSYRGNYAGDGERPDRCPQGCHREADESNLLPCNLRLQP